ncbi:MAG: response regulator, partial [Burkholderiales bacterium]
MTGPAAILNGARERLLVVEDDPDVARLVQAQLEREGYEVVVNATGAGVLEQVASLLPRMLILDLMLPQAHGLELLRALRQDPRFHQLPVLVLTALGSEAERVHGLDLGADDYMHKPFSPRELAARVRARLRAAPPPPAATLRVGPLELDLRAGSARLRGGSIE